jgi:hypothetical protein
MERGGSDIIISKRSLPHFPCGSGLDSCPTKTSSSLNSADVVFLFPRTGPTLPPLEVLLPLSPILVAMPLFPRPVVIVDARDVRVAVRFCCGASRGELCSGSALGEAVRSVTVPRLYRGGRGLWFDDACDELRDVEGRHCLNGAWVLDLVLVWRRRRLDRWDR